MRYGLVVVGLVLFGLVVVGGIAEGGEVPNLAMLIGLMGVALTAVGLNRRR